MKGMRAWLLAGGIMALLLSGCGESGSAEVAKLRLESPGVGADGVALPSSECGYGTIWLPLEWSEVPEDASELVLYIGQFRRERGSGGPEIVVPYGTVIAGIAPKRRHIALNTIPPEAEAGSFNPLNSCPLEKRGQSFLLRLFAVAAEAPIESGGLTERDVTQLSEEALGVSPPATSSAWADRLAEATLASGGFTVRYGP